MGFFNGNMANAFITLWTTPYIYDFFLQKQLIDSATFDRLMTYYRFIRREMLRIKSHTLWQFKALTEWNKPNFISAEQWQKEQELFRDSINYSAKESKEKVIAFISSLEALPASAKPPQEKANPMFEVFSPSPKSKSASGNSSRNIARKKRKKRPKPTRKKVKRKKRK